MNKPEIFNFGGNFERCRYIDQHGVGPAYFLNKRKGTFTQADKDRWFQAPSGLWYPNIRGGVTSTPGWNQNAGHSTLTQEVQANASLSSLVLNSNYVFGTGGDAVGSMFFLPKSKTLTSIFYYVDAIAGSPGPLTLEIREATTGTLSKPGSTLTFTTTHSANAAPGWNEVSGLSQVLAGDTQYWLVIGDPIGSGTNSNSLSYGLNGPVIGNNMPGALFKKATTSNGWTTAIVQNNTDPVYALYFSDDTAYGQVFTSKVEPADDGNQKGLFIDGWQVDVKLFGVMMGDIDLGNATSVCNIWESTTGPVGTPFRVSDIKYFRNSATIPHVHGFTQPFPTLAAEFPYRIVLDYVTTSGTAGVPDRWRIGTIHGSGEAKLRKGMSPGQGDWYYTQENAGVWDDTLNDIPRFGLFLDDWTPDGGVAPEANTRNFPLVPDERSFPRLP